MSEKKNFKQSGYETQRVTRLKEVVKKGDETPTPLSVIERASNVTLW